MITLLIGLTELIVIFAVSIGAIVAVDAFWKRAMRWMNTGPVEVVSVTRPRCASD